MIPFSIQLKRGLPAHEQVVAAVREAVAGGQLRDGDPFPSVRVLTQELRISPRSAQTAVAALRAEGFLVLQGDSGLMVRAARPRPTGEGAVVAGSGDEHPTMVVAGVGKAPFLPVPRPGEDGPLVFDGYEVGPLIARGGMGLVFEAFDRALHRKVAIKVLAPQIAVSEKARRRFLREARAAAAVDHAHVLPVHAVGEANGCPYLVMPLVAGESLQARITREGALPIGELLRIAVAVARGLAAAHRRGLVHRDIKPDNVLLEASGGERVWLADFGLARALEDRESGETGMVVGTPRFASPEQAQGGEIDLRSDLFSFGSLLYAMATGAPPFDAETLVGVLRKIVEDEPLSPRRIRADLPADLESLIMDLLSKAPGDRPASADEVAACLEIMRSPAERERK